MSEIAVRGEGLGKRYRIGERVPYRALRDEIARVVGYPIARLKGTSARREEARHLWALRDVSFGIGKGEVVGIIGRNGAGKTTLLKVLSRITEPTEGRAEIHGRVASLLEIGTGFHPELTGAENIYFNGAILGMRKREIESRFDEIVSFAEVEKFLDTPVKHYSSGMFVRLSFAVAAHLEPEILLVDEVLAVGDMGFQRRCLGKMDETARSGRTVLFVSHNMQAVRRLCTKGMVLENGRISYIGDSGEAVKRYSESIAPSEGADMSFPPGADKKVEIERLQLLNDRGELSAELDRDFPFRLAAEYRINEDIAGAHIGVTIERLDGSRVCFARDIDSGTREVVERKAGRYRSVVDFPGRLLKTGTYQVTIGIGEHGKKPYDFREGLVFQMIERSDFGWVEGAGTAALALNWETEKLR